MRIALTDSTADVVARELRHHDIETDEVRLFFAPKLQGQLAIRSTEGLKAFRLDASGKGIEGDGIVFGDKDSHAASLVSGRAWRVGLRGRESWKVEPF